MHSFTHNHMATILNLQGLIIYSIHETEGAITVKIGFPRKPKCCPKCQSLCFKKNGKGSLRKIKHGLTLREAPVNLIWQSQRYQCKNCQHTWTKAPPSFLVSGKQRSTNDFRLEALKTIKGTSFAETSRQKGLSYSVLRNTLESRVSSLSLLQLPENGALSLGIDEHCRVKKRFATTITLLKPKQTLLGILPLKSKETIEQWFTQHWTEEQRLRVDEVCMDMAKSFKNLAPGLFPLAKVVIDKFHVVAYFNHLIGQELRIQKQLNPKIHVPQSLLRKLYEGGKYWGEKDEQNIKTIFMAFPTVAELWYWKEEVRSIYWECIDKQEAKERWGIIIANMKDKVAQRTLIEFQEKILNYFDNRTTNAFTEGVHTKMKLIKRYSYGIKNPEVYVKKLILGFINIKNLIPSNTF